MKITKHGRKLFFVLLFSGMTTFALAQGGPPPPPGGGGTDDTRNENNQVGGGAPIGAGIFLLLTMGAAYAGRKVYILKKETAL